MEIKGKRVLVLGGWGLVGIAVCREVLKEEPSELVVLSLEKWQAEEAVAQLKKDYGEKTRIIPAWGNIFLRDSLQGLSREELIEKSEYRMQIIEDVLGDLTEDILTHSHLYQIIHKYKPDIVIDSVNTATALAYQDVFLNYYRVRKELAKAKEEKSYSETLISEVEKLLCTLYIPQLIRHVQILYESMRRVGSKIYVKIGTSGTGGMGLNIPYTHSEEKPSRVLLSKSSVAGAHTLLLFLMARTPDGPITKEIKPTAAIAWKRIGFGEITKHGRPLRMYDCPPDQAYVLEDVLELKPRPKWKALGNKVLKNVFIDTGENGIFSKAEFMAISATGQMEYVTPEEIAYNVVYEIKGGNTGHDIINALDNACMGPTYRAGYMRHAAIQKMEELEKKHGVDSVAFELLGPPRLSKLLYEIYLLKQICPTMQELRSCNEEEVASRLEDLVSSNSQLRAQILSIGIPILMPDGRRLLRGPEIKIPPYRGYETFEITEENIDRWAHDGWVDLRAKNIRVWKDRMDRILKQVESIPPDDTSSRFEHDRKYWLEDESINIGKVVSWIFTEEERGLRMKS
jgi:hypothetical protein